MSATIYDNPDHELLRDQVARFLEREVEPHAAAWEETGMVPRDVLRRMGQAGLLGIAFEGEYGGADADAMTNLVFAEALSQSTFAGFIITVLVHTDMAGPHLHHAGTPAQKAKYLPRVTAGELITAVGISEPGAGSDVAGMRTTARRDGDEWVINGTKMFITNGVHGDLYFVAAKTGTARHDARRVLPWVVRSRRPAGSPATRQNSCSTTCASPPATCWARRARASTR